MNENYQFKCMKKMDCILFIRFFEQKFEIIVRYD